MTEVRTLPIVDEVHDPMRTDALVFVAAVAGLAPVVTLTAQLAPGVGTVQPTGSMPNLPQHMGGAIRG